MTSLLTAHPSSSSALVEDLVLLDSGLIHYRNDDRKYEVTSLLKWWIEHITEAITSNTRFPWCPIDNLLIS